MARYEYPPTSSDLSQRLTGLNHRETDSPRIIGGYVMAPHSSKYLVSLKRKSGFHFWYRADLPAGPHGGPSDYSASSKNADIMLIKVTPTSRDGGPALGGTEREPVLQNGGVSLHLNPPIPRGLCALARQLSRPVAYSPFVSIVPVPRQGAKVRAGRFCQVSGWGYTTPVGGRTSDTLHSVHLPLVPPCKCNSSTSYAGYITKNMICAGFGRGGKDACQGAPGMRWTRVRHCFLGTQLRQPRVSRRLHRSGQLPEVDLQDDFPDIRAAFGVGVQACESQGETGEPELPCQKFLPLAKSSRPAAMRAPASPSSEGPEKTVA
ncbi:hypothetical protein E2320_006375 [Naja naja]|nr:hypothetical protein E2320_006375 [Naja naja]